MKKLLILLFWGAIALNAQALEVPKSSKYDTRMQSLSYNAQDVAQIRAKTGYVTAINFDLDEVIINVAIGFNAGWEAVETGNKIFLKAIAYKYDNDNFIEPSSEEWKTNMLVTTNKRFYVFNLTLTDLHDEQKDNAFLVSFNYPNEKKMEKNENLKLQTEKFIQQKQDEYVKSWLNKTSSVRNWNYFMQVGKKAESITPDFAYDDGVRTFFGFSSDKKIPAIFGYEGDQEVMTNISTRNVDKYVIVLVHNNYERFILRSGNQVVGVTNKSFGKIKTNNSPVINDHVERIIK
ncbi:P-type conjugative transfer protein VirB9 [Orbus sturtevantii]|uniref:P-type conjugative transfer protein VirB9 n=1 Tax=Orbus sturtevantii TaxID=3074109 RepID=UPI00370D8DAC